MNSQIPRFIVENHGASSAGVHTALVGALDLCAQFGAKQITLVMPTKGNFDGTVISEVLGKEVTKALQKSRPVNIEGVALCLESPQTLRNKMSSGVVLAAHISIKDMEIVDATHSANAILFLPWIEEEGKQWLSTWMPKVIGPNTWNASGGTLDSEVEAALDRLTRNINLGSGLGHPSDLAAARRVIATLKSDGHPIDPEEIRRWALRHNWSATAAETLKKICAK